jgi:RimJ/RimL family protein N-acetyltransferase
VPAYVVLHWVSEEHKSAEIGYVFHPARSGHGYAVEAAHRLLHLFVAVFDGPQDVARVVADAR